MIEILLGKQYLAQILFTSSNVMRLGVHAYWKLASLVRLVRGRGLSASLASFSLNNENIRNFNDTLVIG